MPNQNPCTRVREIVENYGPYWQHFRDAMQDERAFLEGDRYEQDPGPYNRDRRLIQIRGQEIQDTTRHVVAQATAQPRNIEPRPIDKVDDPTAAEVAASLVEMELSNPWKMFDDCYEEAVQSARESRLGLVWMDWDPDCGPFGEILFRWADACKFMWDPTYHPHHPKCEWLLEERRMPVEWIHQNFKGSEWVAPDQQAYANGGMLKEGIPLVRQGHAERALGKSIALNDGKATLWFCWYKNDRSTKKREKPGSRSDLKPEDRYMACATCGYKSETQGALIEQGKIEGELPEMLEGCPYVDESGQPCGGVLERVDALAENETVSAYEKGRRLVVMAPFSPAPDDKPLADGPWPIPQARSFPGLFLTSYLKGGQPMGPSDTTLMWDQQIASDHLRTMALQRVFEHRNYWEMPRAGIVDSRGQRFNFRDDQKNIMYRDATQAQYGSLDVKLHTGHGLDPNFGQVFEITQAALTQYRGMNDLGPVEDRAKSKSGIALQTENAIGEIPVEHFKRRCARERSRFGGVLFDYIKATYTPERIARLNIDGADYLLGIDGDSLPNYDFVIEDSAPFTGVEKSRAEAAQALINFAQQFPDWLDIYAQAMGFPKSIVRMVEKRLEEQRAMQEEAEEQAMADGGEVPEIPGETMEATAPGMVPEAEEIGT